jgi:hypothetical protein
MINQFDNNICKKRALCSLFAFLLGLFSFADLHAQQFTECFNYEVGSVNVYKSVHTFYTSDFINEELNKKGSDVIWNLHDSVIVYTAAERVQEIVPATMVFGYNNFVEANIVKKFSQEFNQFLLQDSSGIKLIGVMGSQIEKYLDNKTLINYPHGLFECSVDSFEIDSLPNAIWGWNTEIKGITQNCFDGEGEVYFNSGLVVPSFRYTRTDTIRFLLSGDPSMQIEMETYWYDSNCQLHTPIMFAKGYQDASGFQHYSTIYILKEYALGLDDEFEEEISSFNFKMLHDEIQIINTSHLMQSINLVDLLGRIIAMKTVAPYQNNISISTHQLSNGIYFLKSTNGDSYKISIVH